MTDHIVRNARIARGIGGMAAAGGGTLLVQSDADGDAQTVIGLIALAIGFSVNTVRTRGRLRMADRDGNGAPALFLVLDGEEDGNDLLTDVMRDIHAQAQPNDILAVVVLTQRDRDDIAVHLSRALDIRFRDIHQA